MLERYEIILPAVINTQQHIKDKKDRFLVVHRHTEQIRVMEQVVKGSGSSSDQA
jgi:hypothetical protein